MVTVPDSGNLKASDSDAPNSSETRAYCRDRLIEIKKAMSELFMGREETLRMVLGAFFSDGHVLVEDVPGVGKTTLAKTLAQCMEIEFRRIQFTPDLMPSDVMGISLFDLNSGVFNFKRGPVFTNILMADEINRSSPKTQSSLLEAMEERQVTMDGQAYPLEKPFMVIATQNPVEFEGTFPLPEAQLDRFMVRIDIGYPDAETEIDILKKETLRRERSSFQPLSKKDLLLIRETAAAIEVNDTIYSYVQRLLDASRHHHDLHYGLSPRAGIALIRMAKFMALISDRAFVTPDDIRSVVYPVVAHRLVIKSDAMYRGITEKEVVSQLIEMVPVAKRS
ncbi:MoxR-like ATPase [Acidaminobacter hydrogenoformans DSM 2784]|uniref:MoxR-like ATPase n=1 Tax=Acidaminobacter hydrogenoformans DSM 2784 TaxID=1120920 RepID=A0A1G5RTH0_9FIRM|nr:MoxR-like ATPase [Acidaminobacter hydrogenoformans DSM 2784]